MIWTNAMIGLKFIFFGVIELLVFLVFWHGVQQWLTGRANQNWPITKGHVVTSGVRFSEPDLEGNSGSFPDVRYSYVVSGTTYQGDCVTIDDFSTSSPGRVEKIVGRYPVGTQVMVHYNPQRPREAVLETGTSGGWMLPAGLGLFFVLAFGSVLIRDISRLCNGRKNECL